MPISSCWNEIRHGLRSEEPKAIKEAVIRVGKIQTELLPDDIADAVLRLFDHPEPIIRAEAIFSIGLHWRLPRAVKPIIELLKREDDWHVQLRSIDALGAIGREYPEVRCSVSKCLASVALNNSVADNERMIAYNELLHVQEKIASREVARRDRALPDKLADFEMDRPWLADLAKGDCSE